MRIIHEAIPIDDGELEDSERLGEERRLLRRKTERERIQKEVTLLASLIANGMNRLSLKFLASSTTVQGRS